MSNFRATEFNTNTDIIRVICYSRLNGNLLTAGECTALHQWGQLGVEPNEKLQEKYQELKQYIFYLNWEKPEIKWDNAVLYYFNEHTIK